MHTNSLLSELIDDYCTKLQREKPADEGTQKRFRDALNIMVQLLGDRQINSYNRQDLIVLKAKLYRWPANLHKSEEFSGKTAEEILRMKPVKTLDKRTVDSKYMDKISAVFQHAFQNGQIAENIAQNVVKFETVAEKKANKRKSYDIEDLKKIFAALPIHPDRPHLAWIPLIAAFTGARHGEICGLRVSDIYLGGHIPYMLLTEEDDKGKIITNLSGEVSRRMVPLHHVLIEMGLPQYVAMRKAKEKKLLFELRKKGENEFTPLTGEYYGQSFELYNRKHVSNDLRKNFYSFRYTVHKALQLKNISPELCFAITGHVPQFDNEKVGREDQLLAERDGALKLLEYQGLELTEFKAKLDTLSTR